MISKNQIKFIASLKQKKFRDELGKFVVEGDKLVDELINSDFNIEIVFATKDWVNKCDCPKLISKTENIIEVSKKELERISFLKSPHNVLAVADIKAFEYTIKDLEGRLSIALEDIQDPGNLGTIMRTAAWFGIDNIFCSKTSVDMFNPKVVQATMGAIFKVKVHYVDMRSFIFLLGKSKKAPIYGTYLEGENIYNSKLADNGLIIFGNEGSGISENISQYVTKRLNIPSKSDNIESLNLAQAVGIVCSEFYRIMLSK